MLTPSKDNELLTQARKIMSPIVEDLARRDEVQAICVLSSAAVNGLTQTAFDEESDFDLAIILDIPLKASQWRPRPHDTYAQIADQIPQWVPPFLFYADVPWGRMEINVNQLIYQYDADPRTTWGGEKCEVYSRKAEILLDHGGAFGRVIQQKTQQARRTLESKHSGGLSTLCVSCVTSGLGSVMILGRVRVGGAVARGDDRAHRGVA